MQGSGKLRFAERSGAPATPPTNFADIYLSSGTPGHVTVKHDDGSTADLESGGFISNTFVPAASFGVSSGGGDQTANIQNAFDNVASGSVLAFEPGDFICNQANLTRSDISLFLAPGARLYTTATTTRGTVHIAGTIDTSASVNVIQNPDTNDIAWPRGGEHSIYVASDPGSNYNADKWFSIEDTESRPGGLSSDSTYILEHHMELCRVKAKTSVTGGWRIDLWFPLVNSYTNVGGTAPKLRSVTPLTNMSVWGGGTIENGTAPSGDASHALVTAYTVGLTIDGIRLKDTYNSALHILRCQDFKVRGCDIRDAKKFDGTGGFGYGINIYGGIRGTIQGNTFRRLRHCIDVSYFSRQITIDGNSMVGSTTGNINTHACVEGLVISNNVIDGAFGQDASSSSTEYGTVIAASGINIDENNHNVSITGNTIRNVSRGGIFVDMGSSAAFATGQVSIVGNTLENCVFARRWAHPPSGYTDVGGITLTERSSGGNDRRGIVCKGNTLRECGQFGIICDINHTIIEGNSIYKAEDKTQAIDTPAVGIGVWIRGGASGDTSGIIVRGNVIQGCKQDGIRVGQDSAAHVITDCVVEGNVCVGNLDKGIFLEETASFIKILHNDCYTNVDDGINIQGTDNWLEGNRLVGNGAYGVRMISGANNNLLNRNQFAANTSGSVNNLGTGNLRVDLDTTAGYIYNNGGASTAPFEVRAPFIFNETGADIDARFEGDTETAALMVDASAQTGSGTLGAVGVGTSTPQRRFHTFWQDSTNSTIVQVARFQRSTTSGSNGADGIGVSIELASEDDSGSTQILGEIQAVEDTAAAGSENSSVRVKVYDGGTQKEIMQLEGATPQVILHNAASTPSTGGQIYLSCVNGGAVFNEQGTSTGDVRVEGDTDANLLFTDASADTVQVGAATASDSAKFYVSGKLSTSGEVEINGALNHDGTTVGFYGATPVTQQTYSASNVTTDRTYDANATTVDELADVLGTLIADLRAVGLLL